MVASVAALTDSAPDTNATVAAPHPRQPAEVVLAVLPFDNLSTDPEMQFFSDGVSEEIIQRLSRGANLKLIGRRPCAHRCAPGRSVLTDHVVVRSLRLDLLVAN